MIVALRVLFVAILAVMIAGTTWASLSESILAGGPKLVAQPWGVMTLLDAYFGFITFYVWVAYRETTAAARAGWLVAIMALGNMAMATYVLIQLFRANRGDSLESVLLRRNSR